MFPMACLKKNNPARTHTWCFNIKDSFLKTSFPMFKRNTEKRWQRIPSWSPAWSKRRRRHRTEHNGVQIISPHVPLISMDGIGEDTNLLKNVCLCVSHRSAQSVRKYMAFPWITTAHPSSHRSLAEVWSSVFSPCSPRSSSHIGSTHHWQSGRCKGREMWAWYPQASPGCCAHHMRQTDIRLPLLPLDLRGPWQCCQFYLSCLHCIVLQPAD